MPVSNPYAHYDASDPTTITESGGYVSQWDDLSGNGYDLIQATGARQPLVVTAGQNGLDYLDFAGGRNMSTSSALTALSRSITISCVWKIPPNDGANRFGWSEFGGAPTFSKHDEINKFSVAFGITSEVVVSNAYFGTWRNVTVLALASTALNCRVGDTLAFSASCSGDFEPLCIGAHGGMKTDTPSMWNDDIGEIVLFDRELNSTELTDLNDYYVSKWATP